MADYRIPLAQDTIGREDLEALADWLRTCPRITKGPLCEEFEARFAGWQGVPKAHFVNSGSSANLLAISALQVAGALQNGDRVIAPAISWTTTVAPITQLNCVPILCDAEPDTLGMDVERLAHLARTSGAKAVIVCHVLGIPNRMEEIVAICERHGMVLIEDCCEALGSEYRGVRVGNFGSLSTFSFYFGHHMSTIEGGMICARSKEHSNVIRSIRSHGWNRDLDADVVEELRRRHRVDPFTDKYTFYHPGFNFRGTDLHAFLGLRQLQQLDDVVERRRRIWSEYDRRMAGAAWRPAPPPDSRVAGFAWPLLSPDRSALAARLEAHGVETRPLVCGSIGRQPWFVERYGAVALPVADRVHGHGLYVPIHARLGAEQVEQIAELCLGAGSGSVRGAVKAA
jgi:CDP-4-dehydro-6-deoxyglucose reductase, E1